MIKNSNFIRNSVTAISNERRSTDGGGIYYECPPNPDMKDVFFCDVILEQNLFEENSATNKGGAMRYVNKNFTTTFSNKSTGRRILSDRALQDGYVDSNTYRNNSAAYGSDIASYAFSYTYRYMQVQEENKQEAENMVFAPGQKISIIVKLLDKEGRLFSDEKNAVCNIEFAKD